MLLEPFARRIRSMKPRSRKLWTRTRRPRARRGPPHQAASGVTNPSLSIRSRTIGGIRSASARRRTPSSGPALDQSARLEREEQLDQPVVEERHPGFERVRHRVAVLVVEQLGKPPLGEDQLHAPAEVVGEGRDWSTPAASSRRARRRSGSAAPAVPLSRARSRSFMRSDANGAEHRLRERRPDSPCEPAVRGELSARARAAGRARAGRRSDTRSTRVAGEHLVPALPVEHHLHARPRAASRIRYHCATMLVEPNGSSCA